MLRIYRSPDGSTYQYEEGTQPEDHVLVEPPKPEPKPKAKARTTRNKARTAKTKAEPKE